MGSANALYVRFGINMVRIMNRVIRYAVIACTHYLNFNLLCFYRFDVDVIDFNNDI